MFAKVIATAAVVLTIGVGTANAQTPQGLKADGLRLQAMADRYGQLQGIKADGLRWEAMARAYAARPVVVATSDGFNWGDAGIGAAASFVALLGIGGTTIFVRRSRRTKLAL